MKQGLHEPLNPPPPFTPFSQKQGRQAARSTPCQCASRQAAHSSDAHERARSGSRHGLGKAGGVPLGARQGLHHSARSWRGRGGGDAPPRLKH